MIVRTRLRTQQKTANASLRWRTTLNFECLGRREERSSLYDTFGLPLDFINDVLRRQGRSTGDDFDRAMEEQRTRAKASWKGGAARKPRSRVTRSWRDIQDRAGFLLRHEDDATAGSRRSSPKQGAVNEIKPGEEAEIVLDRTSIYSESGGQVADTGGFYDNPEALEVAEVRGAYYPVSRLVAHRVVAKEDLHVGDRVATVADP